MTDQSEPTAARDGFGDLAPKLAALTDRTLFGDVWRDPALSPRDRSLITIAALTCGYRTNELPFHLKLGLTNELTSDEIVAALTHLAFYAGWPPAMTALNIARDVFARQAEERDRGDLTTGSVIVVEKPNGHVTDRYAG